MARLGDIGNSAGINVLPYLLLLCNRCCCLMRGIVLLQACPFFVGLSSSRRARSFMSRSRRASCRSNFASILRIRKSMRHIFQKCTWVDHGSYSNSHSRVMRIHYCNQAICRAPAWQGSQRSRTADRCFLDTARNQAFIYIYIYIYNPYIYIYIYMNKSRALIRFGCCRSCFQNSHAIPGVQGSMLLRA